MAITNESTLRTRLLEGLVIPAMPLMLNDDGDWDKSFQRGVIRYYIDAGAGGLAVGVHSTQFAIRDPEHGLFESVLSFSANTMKDFADDDFVQIAGICGNRKQAERESQLAIENGYHAGLLSLTALGDCAEDDLINHASAISKIIPVVGFYLQPAVGGRVLSYRLWKSFCEIENVVAIKMAPFDRYLTWDVVRAVIESGRDDIALYTGNDDNIVADLLTPFPWKGKTRFIDGGLLGQWGVWTKTAVEMLDAIKSARIAPTIDSSWLTKGAALTDANAAVFDAANGFAGCIPGILEILRRQGLALSNRCLDPNERLSAGQSEQITRICEAYPELTDDEFVAENLGRWRQNPAKMRGK